MNDTVASIYFYLPSLSILRTSGRNEETASHMPLRQLPAGSCSFSVVASWTRTIGRKPQAGSPHRDRSSPRPSSSRKNCRVSTKFSGRSGERSDSAQPSWILRGAAGAPLNLIRWNSDERGIR
jgi:hypothetical protein